MALNQTNIFDALQGLTAKIDRAEFIHDFLLAYGFPKATVTHIRNGSTRNFANQPGAVGLKKSLYFTPVVEGENVFEVAERVKDSDLVRSNRVRFVIVTDFVDLVAYDLNTDERMESSLTALHEQYAFFLPLAGFEKSGSHAESIADIKAAEKMGRLFDLVRERNDLSKPEDIHALNVFLTRLLFCFFAEDTGIFGDKQLTTAIRTLTREDGSDVDQFFYDLFGTLNLPENAGERAKLPAPIAAFPYVNGGLFQSDEPIPAFGAKSRRMLLDCGSMDWSAINPDIFGSMFQAVIDVDQRSTLGQHYTSVTNIMRVIQPLFLDKLYAELERSLNHEKKLQALLERVARIKVFDPACGSGNFLIIAYKELRKFEIAVLHALNAVSKQRVMFMSGIKLAQFHGIEIDDFAHEIALLSLWLAEHQMNQVFKDEFGHVEPMLPLKSSGQIAHGNSLHMEWNSVCPKMAADEVYVIGNPPFLGHGNRSPEQLRDMASVLKHVKNYKSLDYVACWFWKGAQYIKSSLAELALVSTNSICQGKQVAELWPSIFDCGLEICIAYQSFSWSNSAKDKAGVHVVIVGLSARPDKKVIFNCHNSEWHGRVVENISPYLLEGSNTIASSRTKTLCPANKMIFGNMPIDGGHLMMTRHEKDKLLAQEPAAARWIKRIYGSDEFINSKERYCLWLAGISEDELAKMPAVMARVSRVAETRRASTDEGTRKLAQTPHIFRDTNNPAGFVMVPSVSSERREYVPMGLFGDSVITTNLNLAIPNGTLYEFGILTSTMHNDWLRVVGGRLKSDYRYSASLVYNTFPWPEATDSQCKQIEELAGNVLLAREDYPDKSLADLYDPDTMPAPLKAAHQALDLAVERLYRTRPFRDGPERLEFLFARYETLIEQERQQQAAEPAAKKQRKSPATKAVQ